MFDFNRNVNPQNSGSVKRTITIVRFSTWPVWKIPCTIFVEEALVFRTPKPKVSLKISPNTLQSTSIQVNHGKSYVYIYISQAKLLNSPGLKVQLLVNYTLKTPPPELDSGSKRDDWKKFCQVRVNWQDFFFTKKHGESNSVFKTCFFVVWVSNDKKTPQKRLVPSIYPPVN